VFTWDAVAHTRRVRFAAAADAGGDAPCDVDEPIGLDEAPAAARL
jgi:hypothetical protein